MGTVRSRAKSSAGSSARAAALRAIRRVVEQGAYSNLAIPGELDRAGLSARDRAFAGELAYGTLRKLLPIDHALGRVSARPLKKLDPAVLATLRIGAYQLLFTRVPAHAAVSETVELAPPRARGFVNAALRALARAPSTPPVGSDDRAVSIRTGLAEWAVAELRKLLPEEEVEPAAAALASPAPIGLRTNACRTGRDTLERALRTEGHAVEPGRFHPDALRVRGVAPSRLPGFDRGWFAVQDEASVMVGAAVEAAAGERILDACAGPGGKAAHLACSVGPNGRLVAADVHLSRARLVRTTATRLGVALDVLVQDARRPSLIPETFDAVLVDAPCSGLGAARRRPELLWRPHQEDLSGLARLQVAVLCGVAPLLRPAGRLVYSICTFPRAETDAAVRAFLAKRPDFAPGSIPGPDGRSPVHRMWPHRHDTDAMFFAGFVRRSG